MSRPHIWTIPEVQRLREFGGDSGWFYGFVRDKDGKLYFSEIFPGLGFAKPNRGRLVLYPWWSPKTWRNAIRDAMQVTP